MVTGQSIFFRSFCRQFLVEKEEHAMGVWNDSNIWFTLQDVQDVNEYISISCYQSDAHGKVEMADLDSSVGTSLRYGIDVKKSSVYANNVYYGIEGIPVA